MMVRTWYNTCTQYSVLGLSKVFGGLLRGSFGLQLPGYNSMQQWPDISVFSRLEAFIYFHDKEANITGHLGSN
jgi:hypothetical protein